MLIRDAREDDAGALAEVFFRSVRDGAQCYTHAQRAAWARAQPSATDWQHRLEGLQTILCEDTSGIAGFMSLRADDGYLDLAFVRPDRIGTGIGAALYAVVENRARAAGVKRLHTHASDMLMPVLQARGWDRGARNTVERDGIKIDNWIMEKHLT